MKAFIGQYNFSRILCHLLSHWSTITNLIFDCAVLHKYCVMLHSILLLKVKPTHLVAVSKKTFSGPL